MPAISLAGILVGFISVRRWARSSSQPLETTIRGAGMGLGPRLDLMKIPILRPTFSHSARTREDALRRNAYAVCRLQNHGVKLTESVKARLERQPSPI